MKKTTVLSLFTSNNTSLSAQKHAFTLVIASILLAVTSCAQAETAMPTLIFGANTNGIRDTARQDMELSFNNGIASLSGRYGIITKLKVYDSLPELIGAFEQGKIDGILSLPTTILALESQLKPQLTSLVYDNGQYKFRYLLLVRKADNISSIEQLQGKRISIPKFQEIESLYLNTLLLRHNQREAPLFFSEMINAANSNITINDLFFGRVDTAIVNENEYRIATELNPQIAQKMQILEQSEPMLMLVAGVRKTLPDDITRRSQMAATEYLQSEAGRNAYKFIGMKSMQLLNPSELDSLRALKSEYAQLKNARKLQVEPKPPLHAKQKPAQGLEIATDKIQRTKKSGGLQ